jgi:hypothetical protein
MSPHTVKAMGRGAFNRKGENSHIVAGEGIRRKTLV